MRLNQSEKRYALGLFGKLLMSIIGVLPVTVSLIVGLVSVAPVSAQLVQASGPRPSFEVATIKPSSPARVPHGAPNMYSESGGTARGLVADAYGLPVGAEDRVLGGPAWIDHKRYDIEAKIPDALFAEMQKMPPKDYFNQILLMEQSLLADRFKLKVHFETREMPIYELIVAKDGPKLSPAKETPPGPDTPQPPPGRPQGMRQGINVFSKTPNTMEMLVKGMTLDRLIMVMHVPRFGLGASPIVNKTGLTGKYDFVLDWEAPHPAMSGSGTAAAESDAPPLSIALEQQLGLKLVETKGPVDVVVIDHIEPLSPN
jgi:bla regulator protein blaR1